MRKQVLAVAVVGVAVLALAGAAAWAAGPVAVDIPFKFNVTDREMPAGHYELQAIGMDLGKVVLKSTDGGTVVVPVLERLAATGAEGPRVVFDERDGTYYLSEFHVPGQDGFLVGMVKGEQKHRVLIGKEKE